VDLPAIAAAAGGDPPATTAAADGPATPPATDGSTLLAQVVAATQAPIASQAPPPAGDAAPVAAALNTKLVPDGKDQAKQVADPRGQKGNQASTKLAGTLAGHLSPPLEGAQVISADAAGDQGAGTPRQDRDPSSPRREHAGSGTGDPIPVVRLEDFGLPQAPMTARPNAPVPSFAGPADLADVVAAPLVDPAVPGVGRRDQVVLQLADDLGRIRVSVRGETVRATLLPNDGALATRLTAEARSLERSLSDQGFSDARVTVQPPRPAPDAAPIWNQAAKVSEVAVDNMKAQAGSRSQDEAAHDSREGERRDDPRTRDQRGQRGQRARQQKEKEPQQ